MGKGVIEPQTGALQDALAGRVDAQQTERSRGCRCHQQPQLPGSRHGEIIGEQGNRMQGQQHDEQAGEARQQENGKRAPSAPAAEFCPMYA